MCSSRGLRRTTGPAGVSRVPDSPPAHRDATVFLVQTRQLEDHLSVFDHIVVELPPRRRGRQTRARERSERVEIQPVDDEADDVCKEQGDRSLEDKDGEGCHRWSFLERERGGRGRDARSYPPTVLRISIPEAAASFPSMSIPLILDGKECRHPPRNGYCGGRCWCWDWIMGRHSVDTNPNPRLSCQAR